MWSRGWPHHAAGGNVLILTWQTGCWKSLARPEPLHFRIIWLAEPSNCTSVCCQVLTTAAGKLKSAFWYHFWWQLGHARGSKWRDTLNGLLHNPGPDTKILQQLEMPKTDLKKRGYKRGDWETRQSWLIPPPPLPFSINWTHSYLMHF